jgi:hypothetical protein
MPDFPGSNGILKPSALSYGDYRQGSWGAFGHNLIVVPGNGVHPNSLFNRVNNIFKK